MACILSICRKEVRAVLALPGAYVLLAGAGMLFLLGLLGPAQVRGPIFALTGFAPDAEWNPRRDAFLAGCVRLAAVLLIPMITMRLFVEEKQNKSIDMLLTSPIKDQEIVLGKWLGGVVVYAVVLALSIALYAFASRGDGWRVITDYEVALLLQGCGLIAVGESISSASKHESAAAALTLFVSMALLRVEKTGAPDSSAALVCVSLIAVGWLLTWRSIRSFRDALFT